MSIKYTVWTGSKFKGVWGEKARALRYMAIQYPASQQWLLVEVDLDRNLNAEVEPMVLQMVAEEKARKSGTEVHHLKAESIEVTSSGKVGS